MPIADTVNLWDDPRLIYAVAIAGIVLLAITIWLFRRSKREGRAAGTICLIISVLLHAALLWLVPYQSRPAGGSANQDDSPSFDGASTIEISSFAPDATRLDDSGQSTTQQLSPLPVAEMDQLLQEPTLPATEPEVITTDVPNVDDAPSEITPESPQPDLPEPEVSEPELASTETESPVEKTLPSSIPDSLTSNVASIADDLQSSLEELFQTQLELENADLAQQSSEATRPNASSQPEKTDDELTSKTSDVPQDKSPNAPQNKSARETIAKSATPAITPGNERADFANRVGAAKQIALTQTGGDAQSEAAVKAALRFLAASQRPDGSWDPRASGAGAERYPLGEGRRGAGTKCTTGLTGLSLLAMMGAGHTHLDGEYADNVYRGLAYLIQNQDPDGALSGDATVYAASYCHSMASLAVCEAAVMTQDRSALESSRRALAHTLRMQHPVTGGWRYTRGDPGDLSQLGWQAMVLDAAKRAGLNVPAHSLNGVKTFLRSVRSGQGGLACYRPREATSRTMTAEALATRLMIGENVPQREIAEAERHLLESPPGRGQDNYYYWYYATLALHQLQDDAWNRWNQALKQRLLKTQRPDGSWSSGSLWGGYGGTIYTTSMATLCLETYYRHALRNPHHEIASKPGQRK